MLQMGGGGARLTIDSEHGGRISSLVVAGRELVMWRRLRTIDWGSYPMAPFAGRVRDGRFAFEGRTYQLPTTEGPNAIHGTTLDGAWTEIDDHTIAVELADPWPFAGRVTQAFALGEGRLDTTMTLEAAEPMPAVLGWHPWFVRRPRPVDDGDRTDDPDLEPASLTFEAGSMYLRAADGLPTGESVDPSPPPWDDCFVDVREGPTITWPGFLELDLSSDARHWVVYTGDQDGLAVEPQTGPPDGLNLEPRIVEPGAPLSISMTWRWRSLAD